MSDETHPTESSLPSRVEQSAKQYWLILLHLFIAVAAFVAAAYYVNLLQRQPLPFIGEKEKDYLVIAIINAAIGVFATYFPLIISIWVGLKFAARANALMRAAFYEQTSVVPQKDFELIKTAIQQGNPAPISEYIRLVSLTGGVGLFTKIGLTGLPLVTLGLVLFFACGVLFSDGSSESFKAFLDFTKLTLGAFIGSFVQRQVENRSRETELQRAVENITRGGGTQSPNPVPQSPAPPATPSSADGAPQPSVSTTTSSPAATASQAKTPSPQPGSAPQPTVLPTAQPPAATAPQAKTPSPQPSSAPQPTVLPTAPTPAATASQATTSSSPPLGSAPQPLASPTAPPQAATAPQSKTSSLPSGSAPQSAVPPKMQPSDDVPPSSIAHETSSAAGDATEQSTSPTPMHEEEPSLTKKE
jgi:hypothetical protein